MPVFRRPRRPRTSAADAAPSPAATYSAALRLLGARDYTIAELRARLLDRGHPTAHVDATVARLTADRSLDDRRVAAAAVRTAVAVRHRGRHRIERDLLRRGVDRGLVRELLRELDPDTELDAARRALGRRRPSGPSDPAGRRRMAGQLLRRGFSSDIIRRVLGGWDEDD